MYSTTFNCEALGHSSAGINRSTAARRNSFSVELKIPGSAMDEPDRGSATSVVTVGMVSSPAFRKLRLECGLFWLNTYTSRTSHQNVIPAQLESNADK